MPQIEMQCGKQHPQQTEFLKSFNMSGPARRDRKTLEAN
jgi:hypothetical protein